MSLPIFQFTIVRDNGDVVPNAEVSVVLESTGVDANIFSDRQGNTQKNSPHFADSNGFFQFYASPGDYRITAEDSGSGFSRTWRYVPLFSPDSDITTSTGTQTLVEALDDRVRTHEFADQIEIIAHRGFRNVFVQNTLPALLSAISSGVNSIEFDVQTSAEGTPYLFHDASVNSLTDGSGSFVGLNDNVIDGLKYTQANGTPLEGVGIPKLQTLVNELRYRKSFIYPEIKAVNAPSDITGMVEMVKSAQMSKRCMWQSFNYSDLAVVRNADPDVEIGFLMGSSSTAQDVMDGVNSLLEDFGPNQGASVLVQFSVLLSNPSLVSYARDRGIDVGTWTVNEFKDVISLTNINVFRIMTDTNFKGVSQ